MTSPTSADNDEPTAREARVLFRLIDRKGVAFKSEVREGEERLYSVKPKVVVERLVSRWD